MKDCPQVAADLSQEEAEPPTAASRRRNRARLPGPMEDQLLRPKLKVIPHQPG